MLSLTCIHTNAESAVILLNGKETHSYKWNGINIESISQKLKFLSMHQCIECDGSYSMCAKYLL